MIAEQEPTRPADVCLDEDAYNYESTDVACNDVWREWDDFCRTNWMDECDVVEHAYLATVAEEYHVPRPAEACLTEDAYIYASSDEVCNDAWINWDSFCANYPIDECYEVEQDYFNTIDALYVAPRPADPCLTEDAYWYESEDTVCNNIWKNWDDYCHWNWTKECDEAEDDIFGEF